MNNIIGLVQKSGHAPVEIRKVIGIPKPLSEISQLRIKDESPIKFAPCEINDTDIEFRHQENRLSLDCQTSIDHIEAIIKSLDCLKNSENGNANVCLSVNIFYQPVFRFSENPQILQTKTQKNHLSTSINPYPIIKNQEILKNIEKISSPKTLLLENKQMDKITNNEKTRPDFSESQSSNVNYSSITCKKDAFGPTRCNLKNKSEEIILRKRRKIENNCMCGDRKKPIYQITTDPFFDQQLTKIKYFWRGTNSSYPFAFKKKVMKYYIDTDEISIDDIVDYSQKVIMNDKMLF